jgi:hypothetical protein
MHSQELGERYESVNHALDRAMEAKSDVEKQLAEKAHAKLAVDLMLTRYASLRKCVFVYTFRSPQQTRGLVSFLVLAHAANACLRTQGEEGHCGFE